MRKIFLIWRSLFVLIISITSLADGQSNSGPLQSLVSKINTYTTEKPTEKVYLHFDKTYYAAGDTIYFKAYIVIGAQHKLSALSGVLYVDIISPTNKVTGSLKLQTLAGVASGDFALSDNLEEGNYRVRAYTNWMRNEGVDSFFEQIIPVSGNMIKRDAESGVPVTKISSVTEPVSNTDVQFLPEGGSVVAGNYSKIAFKALGNNGLGAGITGKVVDENGKAICEFSSSHSGMGAFSFVPKAGSLYKAIITFEDGTTRTVSLPEAKTNGYSLNINNTNPDTVKIRIAAGGTASLNKLSIVAQSGGIIYYAAENQSGGRAFSAMIPVDRFPTGIVQFTLFSESGEPLAERLLFINHHDQLKLLLNTDNKLNTARQKVKFDLNAGSKDNKAAIGSFSVAVTDETKIPADTLNENTILTSLLLTSELKGAIEQPEYYFANCNEQTQADLDNLMLTQGYRYFEWKKILADSGTQTAYQPEKAIRISGTVKRNGKPVQNARVKLMSKTGGMFMLDTLTDARGKFLFSDLIFADSTKFLIQAKVTKGQDDVTLEPDSARAPPLLPGKRQNDYNMKTTPAAGNSDYSISQKRFYEEQQKYGINQHAVALKEVEIEAKKIPVIPHSDNLNGSGNADQIISPKDLERYNCQRIADCLLITGAFFRGGKPYLIKFNAPSLPGHPMAILLDGTFVDDDVFSGLHPEDIEGIEVVSGPHYGAIYGSRMAYGGLIITTKRAKKQNNYYRYAPGVITYMPKGFYKAREFYSPQHDNPHTNQKMADLRSTIYWNPNIITDKDGKASFSYFNADGKGTYRVVIEGIDADGNLGRQVFRYKVE